MNNPLVEQIYDKQPDLYKDLRPFHSVVRLQKRRDQVRRLMAKIPKEKRICSNRTYWKLATESRLLGYKEAIYVDKGPVMTVTRWKLQLIDKPSFVEKEGPSTKASMKKQHTLPLLNLIHIKDTDEELRAILASIDVKGLLYETDSYRHALGTT